MRKKNKNNTIRQQDLKAGHSKRQTRVTRDYKRPNLDKITQILIENIPLSEPRDKFDLFCSQFGSLAKIKVSKSRSKNFDSLSALVNYSILKDRSIFTRELSIDGRVLRISERQLPPPELNKLFLGSLPTNRVVEDRELSALFQKFGSIKEIIVIFNRSTKWCKGYAFITFDDELSVQRVLESEEIYLGDVRLICDRPKQEGTFPKNTKHDDLNESNLNLKTNQVEELQERQNISNYYDRKPLAPKFRTKQYNPGRSDPKVFRYGPPLKEIPFSEVEDFYDYFGKSKGKEGTE